MAHELTIDNIGDIDDGVVRKLADRALAEALADCDSRPMLKKPRKVEITVALEPVVEEGVGMKGVRATVSVRPTVPPKKANGDYLPTSVRGQRIVAFLPDSRQDGMFRQEAPDAS